MSRVCVRPLIGVGVLFLAAAAVRASEQGPAPVGEAGTFEPSATQLRRLSNADEAEAWLSREIPVGLTLAEAPEFFGAADEIFFSPEEQLYVYAYRSAVTGRWIAWVAFDADRTAVVHTAAVDLER